MACDQASGFSQKTVNCADDSLFVYIIFGGRLECSKIGNKRNPFAVKRFDERVWQSLTIYNTYSELSL